MRPRYQCTVCHNTYDGEKPFRCNCKNKKFEFVGYADSIPSENNLKILKDPNLFQIVLIETEKREPVEIDARKALIILITGRHVENCNPESFNALVNGPSGSGKDYLIKSMLDLLVEEEEKACLTASTPKYLRYAHANEEDFTWDGKVIYLEDVSQETLDSDVFKVHLTGKGTRSGIVDNGKAIDLNIKGKAAILCTTAHSNLNNEGLRRLMVIPVTANKEKITNVIKHQAIADVNENFFDYNPTIQEALSKLNRVKVFLPFGERLALRFPTPSVIAMSVHARFRDWIKACTAFHQYQREKDENGRLIATKEDYEIARESFLYCAAGSIKPVTMNQRLIIDAVKKAEIATMAGYAPISTFSESVSMARANLYKNLETLVESGFLSETKIQSENNRWIAAYKVSPDSLFTLPSYDELFQDGPLPVVQLANDANQISPRVSSKEKAEAIIAQLRRYANGPKVPITFLEKVGVYDEEVVRSMKKSGEIFEPTSGYLQIGGIIL